jgi:hypothetical protein
LIVGNYYVLTLLVFIAATACALVLTRRLRSGRAQSTPEPDAVRAVRPDGIAQSGDQLPDRKALCTSAMWARHLSYSGAAWSLGPCRPPSTSTDST